ncbi:hypothetical protein SBRCBS47491_004385 [Sporothrix bragantina]|uniref:Zn(2)-C6 fungal-type domain-containing protein n=1 Tax=Sporothrix bragantina TaxID=671064 RepID=A0ABP0BMV9_9PEZI
MDASSRNRPTDTETGRTYRSKKQRPCDICRVRRVQCKSLRQLDGSRDTSLCQIKDLHGNGAGIRPAGLQQTLHGHGRQYHRATYSIRYRPFQSAIQSVIQSVVSAPPALTMSTSAKMHCQWTLEWTKTILR